MVDLSNWDFAEHFKAKEIAELICGIPPELNTNLFGVMGDEAIYVAKITPILRRMERAFVDADSLLYVASTAGDSARKVLDSLPAEPLHLHSELIESVRSSDDESFFAIYLGSSNRSVFEVQDFSRAEVSRWLKAIGMTSIYKFDRNSDEPKVERSTFWPWGSHATVALGHLDAAARRFWVNYDPSDATTAPTNETVSEWLQVERGVSKPTAKAIASMLRADGLRPGPRQ